MARGDRLKCKCCLKLFRPDPRNRRHQRYCSTPTRQRASVLGSPRLRTRITSATRFPRPRLAIAPSRVLAEGSTCRYCA